MRNSLRICDASTLYQRMKLSNHPQPASSHPLCLLACGLCLSFAPAQAETHITIQPHSNGLGYVVTYSWKGGFANGMDTASNGSNAYLDDLTTTVSTNYAMPSGNHAGGFIRYSQHDNNGINGDFALVPALGANPVHFDGSNGESLTPGEPMAESSHANIGFTENGGDWYNNPNDFGGVRFFGTGVQGATSLTAWNGIDASSAYGDVQFEGQNLLGQGMQFGVNGSSPGAADAARFGMVGDAKYWNDLNTLGLNNGLLIGYFPYATTFPNTTEPADKFTDQFHPGTYTDATGSTVMHIVNDPNHVPQLVEVAVAGGFTVWSAGAAADEDSNGDGIDNGVAWALGAADVDENAIGLLPTLDNTSDPDFFIFNFNRGDEANDDPGTSIIVEYGSDLGDWTVAETGDDVIITETSGSPKDAVEVKIRRTLAVGDKLFARLKVMVAP